jgi:hypothetical protein
MNELAANHTVEQLRRHFADLRDGSHAGHRSRQGREEAFTATVPLLDPYARQALAELASAFLDGTGEVAASGLVRQPDGGLEAAWTLSWPRQRAAGVAPITLRAHYGANFHHPHLGGATVGEWPLNVFTADEARAQLPTLRAIAAADLHNLVYQRDFRLVPAIAGQ